MRNFFAILFVAVVGFIACFCLQQEDETVASFSVAENVSVRAMAERGISSLENFPRPVFTVSQYTIALTEVCNVSGQRFLHNLLEDVFSWNKDVAKNILLLSCQHGAVQECYGNVWLLLRRAGKNSHYIWLRHLII